MGFSLCCFVAVRAVPVNVMMPLDTIAMDGSVKDPQFLENAFDKLSAAGVHGVMLDVWWGLTETRPQVYSFGGYREVVDMAKKRGLKVQPVMSFHRCGGNIGDAVWIDIPQWALSVLKEHSLGYMDKSKNISEEYLSLAGDDQRLLPSAAGENKRTPLDVYGDFMTAFAESFKAELSDGTIDNIQVGLGPCGELRYPAYPDARWKFPGVGEFQAFDPWFEAKFKAASTKAGHPEWDSAPTDAGSYNSKPQETSFFTAGYKTDYGRFFLSFYQQLLVDHGAAVLQRARRAFPQTELAFKVAGIHWWHGTDSRASELTAGYNDAAGSNAYEDIMEALGADAHFDFTCLEMTDASQAPNNCASQPEELVRRVIDAVKLYGGVVSGENALEMYDSARYQQILAQLRYGRGYVGAFTFLRLSQKLLEPTNIKTFTDFVKEAAKL